MTDSLDKRVWGWYRRIARRLRISIWITWVMAFFLLLVVNALVYGALRDFLSPAADRLFVFGSFWGGLVLSLVGALWSTRRAGVARLARANLLRLFPEQARDLDAWFTTRETGPEDEPVRHVLRRRLDASLPDRLSGRLADSPYVINFVVVTLALLVTAALVVSPRAHTDRYFRRLSPVEIRPPLRVSKIQPNRQWVLAGETVTFDLEFEEAPDEAVWLRVDGDEQQQRALLRPVGERRFAVTMTAPEQDFSVRLTREGEVTRPRGFRILPDPAVELLRVHTCGLDGRLLETFAPAELPIDVAAGTELRFDIAVADCPLRSFGIGGDLHGELPLRPLPNERHFQGRVQAKGDDAFALFWQYTLDGVVRHHGSYGVACLPDEPPEVELRQPADRERYEVAPGRIIVAARATDDNRPAAAQVLVGDYYSATHRQPMTLIQQDDGSWLARTEIVVEGLPPRQGRLLGFSVAVTDNAAEPNTTVSAVHNVVLPPEPLAPDREQQLDDFLRRHARDESEPDQAEEPEDPLDKLRELAREAMDEQRRRDQEQAAAEDASEQSSQAGGDTTSEPPEAIDDSGDDQQVADNDNDPGQEQTEEQQEDDETLTPMDAYEELAGEQTGEGDTEAANGNDDGEAQPAREGEDGQKGEQAEKRQAEAAQQAQDGQQQGEQQEGGQEGQSGEQQQAQQGGQQEGGQQQQAQQGQGGQQDGQQQPGPQGELGQQQAQGGQQGEKSACENGTCPGGEACPSGTCPGGGEAGKGGQQGQQAQQGEQQGEGQEQAQDGQQQDGQQGQQGEQAQAGQGGQQGQQGQGGSEVAGQQQQQGGQAGRSSSSSAGAGATSMDPGGGDSSTTNPANLDDLEAPAADGDGTVDEGAYAETGADVEAGRPPGEGGEIDDLPDRPQPDDEITRPPSAVAETDPTGDETAEPAAGPRPDDGAGIAARPEAPIELENLSPSEREALIRKYSNARDRLTTRERQAIDEYYRLLRDIQ